VRLNDKKKPQNENTVALKHDSLGSDDAIHDLKTHRQQLQKASSGAVPNLVPTYNTHTEQSREHFCQAASYIAVLSIIP
jgi:hypothetical protein